MAEEGETAAAEEDMGGAGVGDEPVGKGDREAGRFG